MKNYSWLNEDTTLNDEHKKIYEDFIYDSSRYAPLSDQEVTHLLNLIKETPPVVHTNILFGIVDLLAGIPVKKLGSAFLIPSEHPAWNTLLDYLFYERVSLPKNVSGFLPADIPVKDGAQFISAINRKISPTVEDLFLLRWLISFGYYEDARLNQTIESIIKTYESNWTK